MLLEMVLTLQVTCSLTCRLYCRQKQRYKKCDDAYNYQQFDQTESLRVAIAYRASRHHEPTFSRLVASLVWCRHG